MRHFIAIFAALWLGLHIGFGYIAAPLLFRHLDKATAGNIAGDLFHWSHLLGIAAWLLVCIFCVQDNRRCYRPAKRTYALVLLLLLLLVNQFLVTPVIVALKTNTPHWLHALTGGSFAAWHGVSSVIYLITTILGFFLCAVLIRWNAAYR